VITVGAYEAKTRLSQLLSRVEEGETVTITKHGHPVARLVGFAPAKRPIAEVVADLERLRKGIDLQGDSVLDYIREGRERR
jgi:prevent-host-death family protein